MPKQLILTPKSSPATNTELNRVIGVRYVKATLEKELSLYTPFRMNDLDAVLKDGAIDYVLGETEEEILGKLCLRYPSTVPGGSLIYKMEMCEVTTLEYATTEKRWERKQMRRQDKDKDRYHDCYVILPRPYVDDFGSVEELQVLTAEYNSVFVGLLRICRKIAEHTGAERFTIAQVAAVEWLRNNNFTATYVERYDLIRVKYDPKRVAELDYAEAKREYNAKMVSSFTDDQLRDLVEGLSSFPERYSGMLSGPETYTTGGWGRKYPRHFSEKQVLDLIEIRRKLFGAGCYDTGRYNNNSLKDKIENALAPVHGILKNYRASKQLATERAAEGGSSSWKSYMDTDTLQRYQLARWLLRAAHALNVTIPPRPKPPALPAHKRKKGKYGSRQKESDQAAV